MSELTILKYPDPRLRTKAQPITQFDQALGDTVKALFATMRAHDGLGLAATQVNIHQRLFVMDVSETKDQPYCIINPEIVSRSGTQYETEACLSVGGGTYDKVKRAETLVLKYQDEAGQMHEMTASGLLATCIQHETDHLNGILFIDHLSRLKQSRIRQKIEKLAKQQIT